MKIGIGGSEGAANEKGGMIGCNVSLYLDGFLVSAGELVDA